MDRTKEDELNNHITDAGNADNRWRKLNRREVRILKKNGNVADNWENLLVGEGFLASRVHRCSFVGKNKIGAYTDTELNTDGLSLPVGMSNSVIISCVVGNNTAIHNVSYLSGYTIGSGVLLFNIDEMTASNDGQKEAPSGDEAARVAVANENGGRAVALFPEMTAADAFLGSRNRERLRFQENLLSMATNEKHDFKIGDGTVIRSCRLLKNLTAADCTRITGAAVLKNVTIDGSPDAPTSIGEGVELVDGVIGAACRVSFGAKAIRFCLGTNVTLSYGARFIDSVIGDNGTVLCCEVVSALLFPFHEQHHNNSFVIAATIQGQSDIAAGGTIGSNHNSRAADGEIFAGRGFWPGLCVNVKHPSKFASHCLIAKGTYPAELHIALPFTLVSNDIHEDVLQLYPGYWFHHNMYGLGRNSWKLKNRDRHLYAWQNYEYDYLAPDTVEELFEGMVILENYRAAPATSQPVAETKKTRIDPKGIEASKRGVVILNLEAGRRVFREMIHYYGVRTLLYYMQEAGIDRFSRLRENLDRVTRERWVNLGGQLVKETDYLKLVDGIENGSIDTWKEVHTTYRRLAEAYPKDKAGHALASLLSLYGMDEGAEITTEWKEWVAFGVELQNRILTKTIESRSKDYQNEFRKMMYDSDAEMNVVMGNLDDNSFIQSVRSETDRFTALAAILGDVPP